MARRPKAPEHENHERWLVSYADFITLLFAFFVVMFASSQTDKAKAQATSEAFERALSDGKSLGIPPQVAKILGGTVDDKGQGNAQMHGPGGAQKAAKEAKEDEDIVELTPSMKVLTAELKQEIAAGKVEISMERRGLVVSLKEAAFFTPGNDVIDKNSYPTLGKVADSLNAVSNPLQIEGHTDSQPIHNSHFRSNWELSSARAISMMELLTTRFNVNVKRVAVAGYADNSPQAPNDTPEGRAKNRRVDIVIMNRSALMAKDKKK